MKQILLRVAGVRAEMRGGRCKRGFTLMANRLKFRRLTRKFHLGLFGVLVALGILIGVAYTLRAVQKAFFSGAVVVHGAGGSEPESGEGAEPDAHGLEPITVPERIGAAVLMVTTLLIGLYPRLLLDLIEPALNTPLMMRVMSGITR